MLRILEKEHIGAGKKCMERRLINAAMVSDRPHSEFIRQNDPAVPELTAEQTVNDIG
mgnify:FL=1